MRARLLLWGSLFVGVGVGCMTGDGMQTKLRDATTGYNRSLRWGDIDRAAEYLPAKSQDAFLNRHERVAERLVIVDYEVSRLDLDKTKGVAASRAQVLWHTERSTVVKTTVVDQLWQFHSGQFVLVDERRASGTPLGIFAETEEKPHPYLPGLERYRRDHEIGEENNKSPKRRRKQRKREEQAKRTP